MGENSLNIQVQIQPGSSKDQIIGLHNGRLKIKISAPPVDGKANQNLIEFIAKALGVSKSKIEIVKGRTSKLKTLKISGINQKSFSLLLNKYRES
ncbi:MAG: DUF167 domain-containing protein [Candidatus Dadabacteria bacterium]|nr:DUF167 domain-containing protein [Candidatus Dadabacteria bacterium]MCZ6864521.1 DUF167 domain-containing protein [Candidatus Dadabacteria bacterium]